MIPQLYSYKRVAMSGVQTRSQVRQRGTGRYPSRRAPRGEDVEDMPVLHGDDVNDPVFPQSSGRRVGGRAHNGDVSIQIWDAPDLRTAIHQAADYTAPGLSLAFLALFAACAYFHESYTGYTGIAIGLWFVLQFVNQALQEDFRNDIFWSLVSALGNVVLYLFIGYLWTHAKLYLDVWQGHLPTDLTKQVQTCLSDNGENGCFVKFLLDIKWLIVRWMLTWPVSMAYTLSRDPLRIATDLAFEWSHQRYLFIIKYALSHSPGDVGPERIYLLWWVIYFVVYMLIGYAWTHVKLFIDVWQARLPRTLDEELRDVYKRKASYWNFVRRVKWLIMRWVLTWPFSMVHTILRDPLRIVAEFIYKLSQRKYVAITKKAMDWRGQAVAAEMQEQQEEDGGGGDNDILE